MKNLLLSALIITLFISSNNFCQDSLKQLNTRSHSFDEIFLSDSISNSVLLEPLNSIGYSSSMKFYDMMFDSIDAAAESDSAKNTFWGKVETGSKIITKNTVNFTAGISPLFFILLLFWFLIQFVSVFILQPELPEPQIEEAEDE